MLMNEDKLSDVGLRMSGYETWQVISRDLLCFRYLKHTLCRAYVDVVSYVC
jgi:hypothetical protein